METEQYNHLAKLREERRLKHWNKVKRIIRDEQEQAIKEYEQWRR